MKRKRIIWIFVSIALIFVLGLTTYIRRINAPMRQAQREATQIAEKYANLEKTDKFYWYNRNATYFTLFGTNKDDKKIIVVVAEKNAKVTILDQKDGYSETEAQNALITAKHPKEILNVSFGIYKKKPVWEFSYNNKAGNLCYATFSFKTGNLIMSIENL